MASSESEKVAAKRSLDDSEGSGEDGEEDEALKSPQVKRSPGRARGSKNKPIEVTEEKPEADPTVKRGRGRPKKWPSVAKPPASTDAGPKRGRGRPKKKSGNVKNFGNSSEEKPTGPKRGGRGRPKKDGNEAEEKSD